MEKGTQNAIRKRLFLQQGFPAITLTDFLEKESYRVLREELMKLPFQREEIPLSHSLSHAPVNTVLSQRFHQSALSLFLSSVTGKKISRLHLEALHLTWKDYTIISDKEREAAGVDIFLDFTENWSENAGGNIVYKLPNGDFFLIPPKGNTISIVLRKGSVQRFLQYVNHYGKGKERLLVRIFV